MENVPRGTTKRREIYFCTRRPVARNRFTVNVLCVTKRLLQRPTHVPGMHNCFVRSNLPRTEGLLQDLLQNLPMLDVPRGTLRRRTRSPANSVLSYDGCV